VRFIEREFRRGVLAIGFAMRSGGVAIWTGQCDAMRCAARARVLELSRHHRSSSLSLLKAKEGTIRLHLQVQGEVAVAHQPRPGPRAAASI